MHGTKYLMEGIEEVWEEEDMGVCPKPECAAKALKQSAE